MAKSKEHAMKPNWGCLGSSQTLDSSISGLLPTIDTAKLFGNQGGSALGYFWGPWQPSLFGSQVPASDSGLPALQCQPQPLPRCEELGPSLTMYFTWRGM